MIFGSFAGDVSLYTLLEQFVPPFWLHCALSALLVAVLGVAVTLVRISLPDMPSAASTEERRPHA